MPFDNDTRLIFEKYAVIREDAETRMKHLLPLVKARFPEKDTGNISKHMPDFYEKFVKFVANQYDPSPEKSYTQWILKMMLNNSIQFRYPFDFKELVTDVSVHEDLDKTKNALKKFMDAKLRKKLQGTEADINMYKTLPALVRHMDEKLAGVTTKREKTQLQEQKGFNKIAESGQLELYAVTTSEAANQNFQQTQWCVKDPRYWVSYSERENTRLYYMIFDPSQQQTDQVDKRKVVLANFATEQYRDVFDDTTEITKSQAQLFLNAKDYVESHEPKNLGGLYLKMHRLLDLPVPQILIDNAVYKGNSSLAAEIYDLLD